MSSSLLRSARLARADARDLVSAVLAPVRVPAARFCIYSTGRAGSELLVELLDGHPRLRCESEILAVPHVSTRAVLRGRAVRAARAGADVWGFKLVNEHFRWTHPAGDSSFLVEQMLAGGFRFIRLRRRNVLRQALSHVKAEALATYHSRSHTDADSPLLAIDPVDLIFKMRQLEGWEAISDIIFDGVEMLPVWYEDDLADRASWDTTTSRVFEWLGLDPVSTSSNLRVTTPGKIWEHVANYDDVAAVLMKTKYAPLLDADET